MKTKKIGIIGGGQLGKMMILDAKRLDYYFVILDPAKNCPAHSIADEHIVANFDDINAFIELAEKVDVITYEFEHISVEALEILENKGCEVLPSSDILKRIQNKYIQKKWLLESEIPVPDFISINSIQDLNNAILKYNYPIILKTCTGGYDGKGNYVIKNELQIEEAYKALGNGKIPLMVEEYIQFEKEISVLVCKGKNGETSIFPVAENEHVNSILDETIVPARIEKSVYDKALQLADKVVQIFPSCGMLCIEMFVTKEGNVLVNELAPRPHNSGHYTIEGCFTSQFEQHIRAVSGMPLGSTKLLIPTVMKNIIGNKDCKAELTNLSEMLEDDSIKVHIYGKEEERIGRKMGHIIACDNEVNIALQKVRNAWDKCQ